MTRTLALIFGESSNDTAALKHLIPALLPANKSPHCRTVREPGTLSKGAAIKKRVGVARAIAITAKYEARKRPVVVVAHEDCDECEDAHIARMDAMKAELKKVGVDKVVAAAPAWELETWWMLFPEALCETRKCWRPIDFNNRKVGSIENAKEVVTRALRPAGNHSCPDYQESDSERIAEQILRLDLGRDNARIARSMSLQSFKSDLEAAFNS